MMLRRVQLIFLVVCIYTMSLEICSAQVVFTNYPTDDVIVVIGESVLFHCSATSDGTRTPVTWGIQTVGSGAPDIFLSNKTFRDTSTFVSVGSEFRSPLILTNVSKQLDGAIVFCRASDTLVVHLQPQPRPVITVLCPPNITADSTMESSVEGAMLTFRFLISNTHPSSNLTVTKDGQTVSGGRINIDGTGLTISTVNRTDSGNYTITVTTLAGSDSISFYLDVYYLAEFSNFSRVEEIVQGNSFTFNCTPSAANPPPSSYVFERDGAGITEGVSGSILTVSSLKRSENSGNYTCTVTNDVGSVTIATYVNILAPPTAPRQLMSAVSGAFTVVLNWDQPLDNGGSSQPLLYSVRVTNDTFNMSFNSTSTRLTLTMGSGIWHSTMYTVTVSAENEYGIGPPSVTDFTTVDSTPIIESISTESFSLALSLDVVLLTDGGRMVNNYTIALTSSSSSQYNTTVIIVFSDVESPFSVPVSQGVTYSVTVTAANSVGESDPVTATTVTSEQPVTPPDETSNTVGVAVGVVLGGFLFGVLITAASMIGIYFCCIKCCHRNNSHYSVNKMSKEQETVYEECALKDVKIEANPSYSVPSQLVSLGREQKGQSARDSETDYL